MRMCSNDLRGAVNRENPDPGAQSHVLGPPRVLEYGIAASKVVTFFFLLVSFLLLFPLLEKTSVTTDAYGYTGRTETH